MKLTAIGEDVKQALDSLTEEGLRDRSCYAFDHELMIYGTQALAHSYIMQMARDVAEGRMPLEDFIKKYGIGPSDDVTHKSFEGPLSAIGNEGIFIPKAAFRFRDERVIQYFNMDLPNRFRHGKWRDAEGAYGMMLNGVKAEDLNDPGTVEKGIVYSEDLWKGCASSFEKSQKANKASKRPAQPKHITELGRELIRYWSKIILPEAGR